MRGASKLEHCPNCGKTEMKNFVHVTPGNDMEIFIECASCGTFTARYIIKIYTSDKPYESYLRLFHQRPMDSGPATKNAISLFKERLMKNYREVKEAVSKQEDPRTIEEILTIM